MTKTKTKIIERFSPQWVMSIPRSLARGIWSAIEDAVDGKEHTHATENERRRGQISTGMLGPTSRGVAPITEGALDAADLRRERREQDRAEARNASSGPTDDERVPGDGE